MTITKLMKKIFAFSCALFLSSSILFAEVGDDYEEDETDDKEFSLSNNLNNSGDQFIKLGLMPSYATNFDGNIKLGGSGELGYHRFINPNFAWGIDVLFGYNPTIGENVFTYIPIMFDFTYQPTIKNFEIPITVGVGASMENYLNRTYFPGFTAKGSAGIFYRYSPSWSFGLEGHFTYMAQWYSDSKYNDYACLAGVELSARYHF